MSASATTGMMLLKNLLLLGSTRLENGEEEEGCYISKVLTGNPSSLVLSTKPMEKSDVVNRQILYGRKTMDKENKFVTVKVLQPCVYRVLLGLSHFYVSMQSFPEPYSQQARANNKTFQLIPTLRQNVRVQHY